MEPGANTKLVDVVVACYDVRGSQPVSFPPHLDKSNAEAK